MTNLEMVEELRRKANISYAEAKEMLERANWDMLDAMVMLEKEGKVAAKSAGYSTRGAAEDNTEYVAQVSGETFGELMGRFGRWLGGLLKKSTENDIVMERKGAQVICLPVLVFIILLLFCFWIVVPLMIVGLFCGCRYRFTGPDLGKDSINNAMGKANEVADTIKEDIKRHDEKKSEDKDITDANK